MMCGQHNESLNHYKSIATQISHDAGLVYILQKVFCTYLEFKM